MRNNYLYKLAVVTFTAVAFASCSKENGINNTTVIATPYSLYYCDSAGSLWNTNDGIYFKESVFPADGVPSLAIATAGPNLIWIKSGVPVGKITAHVSTNEGRNFNPSYTPINPACFDQTCIMYVREKNKVYLATADGINSGIKVNAFNGVVDVAANENWIDDPEMTPVSGVLITSFIQMKNGDLIAFDWTSRRLFVNNGSGSGWKENIATTPLPGGSQFTITRFNNTIVAIDRSGVNGAWYSPNEGITWYQYTGLPNRKLYAVAAPFDANVLVGTDSNGVYVLQGAAFVPSSAGLTEATTVRSIVGKENIYVNGVSAQFIYIATSKGVYRSQDQGQNWVLVRPGNYFSVY